MSQGGPPLTAGKVLDRVHTSRGELVLRETDGAFEVISNGVFLMDTRDGRSERLLVRAALELHVEPRRVLIGGLGVGFSLVEALTDERVRAVTVAEVEETVVRWHEGPLRVHSQGALDDPRVCLVLDDVARVIDGAGASYDVICLDVDNGPDWTVTTDNARLYSETGLRRALDRLATGGVLSVWSAHPVPEFERTLREVADDVRVLTVEVARGEPDVVYLGRRPASASA